MKYLLTIILFMSVNVFADFNITTLDCEIEGRQDDSFPSKLSIRVDEKRRMMRINLLPEKPYGKIENFYKIQFSYKKLTYDVDLYIQDLYVDYGVAFEDKEFEREFYSCKII